MTKFLTLFLIAGVVLSSCAGNSGSYEDRPIIDSDTGKASRH
ncbi:hypothetical protein Bealeia1_00655 [Candidatus Bealeia paramacronuclearis]|uniref:Lipoprotein n=1 Tax=Candidatus Bealeia paramacronuclearis TaxID=1921001 RepID=A0ABZ2C1Z9_9PROT|nr:hypothetical protein [Candidatus Bealeia paramacronuclearis]